MLMVANVVVIVVVVNEETLLGLKSQPNIRLGEGKGENNYGIVSGF